MGLKEAASRGGAITLAGQVGKVSINLVGIAVLARLLTPEVFGLLAMVTAIVGVGEILRDFGLSSAATQARSLNQAQKSNLFWINLGVGALLFVTTVILAAPVAALYDDSRLREITIALGVSFLLNGFQTQYQAELMRNMRFLALTWTDIASALTGLGVAIVGALAGLEAWALVLQVLALAIARAVLRACVAGWQPQRPTRGVDMSGLIQYGWNVTITQLFVYASSHIDRVILGIRFSPTVVGLYSQASQLVMTPVTQVFPPLLSVALPTLSRIQDDNERFGRYVRHAQLALAYPLTAVFAMGIACAGPLLEIFLGPQWTGAVPYFQILAAAGAFQSVTYIAQWVFLSRGLTGSNLRYSLVVRTTLIAVVIAASFFGPIALAAAYAGGLALAWPFSLWWLSRVTVIPARAMLAGGARILVIGAAASALGSWTSALASANPLLAVLAGIVGATVIYAAATIVPSVRRDYASIIDIARAIRI